MRRFSLGLALAALACVLLPAAAQATPGRGDAQRAQQALLRAEQLRQGIGVHTGRELSPALAELYRTKGDLSPADRKKADALLARPTDTEAAPGHAYSVPEATPICGAHFCVHYVSSTTDAPLAGDADHDGVPDYAQEMLNVFENEVYPCENTSALLACGNGAAGAGWPTPPGDGTIGGGQDKTDVYIEDLGSGLYGYAATDSQPATSTPYAYLVMDNDYPQNVFGYADPLTPLRVTAAHEYNHVLQYGIDPNEDTWMFESTATYFEDVVYPSIDDYLGYMSSWVGATASPITDASAGGGLKMYGSAVWNHFIAGRHGAKTILDAWQAKVQENGGSFAPSSYGAGIAANGGSSFSDEFDDFSAAVAEWEAPGQGFPDSYPDVTTRPGLTVGAAATQLTLDHTTFAFRDVAPPVTAGTTLTLTATLPSGLEGAIALVGRTGAIASGTVTKQIQRLSSGGPATVSLPNAETYSRITAVFVNSDPSHGNWNNGQDDWSFTKDGQTFTGVQVTSGLPPVVSTTAVSGLGQTAATLNGTINPKGQATTYFFEYGTTAAYGSQSPAVAASAGSGSSAQAVSTAVSNLTRGTTYHYRVVAHNASGTSAGADQTFTTLDPPVVSTGMASDLATDGATLSATVDPRGRATTYVFQYGPTAAYGSQIPVSPAGAGSGTGAVAVSQALTGLAQGTTIHYRVVATNVDGTTTGGDQTLRTLDPPVVATGAAGAVTSIGAVLTGTVDARAKATTFTFEYGKTAAYGSSVGGSAGTSAGAVSVADSVSGLEPATLYHFRLSATNADGTTTGSDGTFTTAAVPTTSSTTPPAGGSETSAGLAVSTPAPLSMTLAITKAKLAAVIKKGLTVRGRCSSSCAVTVKLVLPPKLAKKLKLRPTLATVTGRTGAVLKLRISKKAARALARLRKVGLRVIATGGSSDGRKAALSRSITLKR